MADGNVDGGRRRRTPRKEVGRVDDKGRAVEQEFLRAGAEWFGGWVTKLPPESSWRRMCVEVRHEFQSCIEQQRDAPRKLRDP